MVSNFFFPLSHIVSCNLKITMSAMIPFKVKATVAKNASYTVNAN